MWLDLVRARLILADVVSGLIVCHIKLRGGAWEVVRVVMRGQNSAWLSIGIDGTLQKHARCFFLIAAFMNDLDATMLGLRCLWWSVLEKRRSIWLHRGDPRVVLWNWYVRLLGARCLILCDKSCWRLAMLWYSIRIVDAIVVHVVIIDGCQSRLRVKLSRRSQWDL